MVARPPDVDRRVALVNLAAFPADKVARIVGVKANNGLVAVEDGAGRALVSLRGEVESSLNLVVPASGTVYVRAGAEEARVEIAAGQAVPFEQIKFGSPKARPRGALDDALRRGLFATEFGRGYYGGLINQAHDFVPVSFAPGAAGGGDVTALVHAPAALDGGQRREGDPARLPTRLIVGVGASTTVARAFDAGQALRLGLRPRGGSGAVLSLDLLRAARSDVSEWQLTASAGWLWSARLGAGRGWLGAAAGGGVITQTEHGGTGLWSGVAAGGPEAGLTVELPHSFGLWIEAQLFGQVYRREDRLAFSMAPAAWVGGSLGF